VLDGGIFTPYSRSKDNILYFLWQLILFEFPHTAVYHQ